MHGFVSADSEQFPLGALVGSLGLWLVGDAYADSLLIWSEDWPSMPIVSYVASSRFCLKSGVSVWELRGLGISFTRDRLCGLLYLGAYGGSSTGDLSHLLA